MADDEPVPDVEHFLQEDEKCYKVRISCQDLVIAPDDAMATKLATAITRQPRLLGQSTCRVKRVEVVDEKECKERAEVLERRGGKQILNARGERRDA